MLRGLLLLLLTVCVKGMTQRRTTPPLPSKVVVGYGNWGQCDEKMVNAVKEGVNVIIWFSINLVRNPLTGLPQVQGGPDLSCVAERIREIRQLHNGEQVVNLLSIGGWNSPHPDTHNTPEDIFAELDRWNLENGSLFDGFDWDIEGNDDISSPYNTFTASCLDAMGTISQCAKRKGYIFAMAPAESYLDPHCDLFDRSLQHAYPEWLELQPNFKYHGHNAYAYILHKYGKTSLTSGEEIDTFDFVMVQLYEGYSHALYNMDVLKDTVDPAEYVTDLVGRFKRGWTVPFSTDAELCHPDALVSLDPQKLVIGLANGWAGDGKFLFIPTPTLERIYAALEEPHLQVRGFAFWNIKEQGLTTANYDKDVWLASYMKRIMGK